MRAAVRSGYGSPDLIHVEEIDKPAPIDDEVLVRVHAASVNAWDYDLLTGKRVLGFRGPFYKVLGADIAGRVEAAGPNARVFHPGDEVFGDLCQAGWGGFAEYVCAPENSLARKPPSISFADAAAAPQAAAMALKGLRECGKIQRGQKVLINGAGGGVGSFAVQLAKEFGAEVTAVDSAEKLDMVRGVGADHVMDYMREDYTRGQQRYDLILDMALFRSVSACKRVLARGGTLVIIGGRGVHIARALVLEPVLGRVRRKRVAVVLHRPNQGLAFIGALLEGGQLKSAIDRRFRLDETAEAFRYFAAGHAKGKLIVSMDEE